MTKVKLLLGVGAMLALGIGGSVPAAAGPGDKLVCAGGPIAAGVYQGLTVTGNCTIKDAVTINGGVTVADDAYLDAAYSDTMVIINGDVKVGKRARLGLGCSFGYHDCGNDPVWLGRVTVNGNIVANHALTMYLDFVIINGNVVSDGGGDVALVDHPPVEDGLVFPIKDNVIAGYVKVHDWEGAWFGVIRNIVGGKVEVSHTVGTRVGPGDLPDSTEVVTNIIAGDLVCKDNSPPAQIGDSGGSLNTVGGKKKGECTAL
jgi:hypothetical protein